eukprot:m.28463 g.28463  ORF g.28463 m.28463 type:complete len:317 (-) comp11842_c0_seq1:36-986(-)
MGERKVLNKYYPPDFDPSAVPRMTIKRDRQYKVRLMAPFNMRCTNCGNYIYKGTKFNSTKETAKGEEYLGILIFRFYIRCPKCCGEITFKTDPKNTDYVCEAGATRNNEVWMMKDRIGTIDDQIAAEDEEASEEKNAMKALEARTQESKQEMDIIDGLEEIKDANARASHVNVDGVIASKQGERESVIRDLALKMRQEEDAAVEAVFNQGKKIIRLKDEQAPSAKRSKAAAATDILTQGSGDDPAKRAKVVKESSRQKLKQSLVKRKGDLIKAKAPPAVDLRNPKAANSASAAPASTGGNVLGGLLGDYGSSSDSD